MNILICGKQASGKTAVTKALQGYFSYRGTASFIYDYLHPLNELHDVIYVVGKQYGMPETFKDNALMGCLYNWNPYLCLIAAVKSINEATERWKELNMFYVAVVDGVIEPKTLPTFPGFKVYLDCPKEDRMKRLEDPATSRGESHPLESGFNDCAVCDIFDLVVDTSKHSPEEVANLIGTQFLDKMKSVFS